MLGIVYGAISREREIFLFVIDQQGKESGRVKYLDGLVHKTPFLLLFVLHCHQGDTFYF